jgi:phosphatidylinositol alpha-mannosyltransferase
VRVAIAHPYSWPGVRRGGERYLADLATYLTSAGHDVDVVTGDGRPLHQRLARRGLSPLDTFGASAWWPLLRGRYDVVHALVPSAALAARAAGRPTVYTSLGIPRAAHLAERPTQRRLLASALRRSTVVTALSRDAVEGVRAFADRPVVELPPGVRTDAFPLEHRPRTGPPRLLFAADASDPRKGLASLLTALDTVLDVHPEARLQLAGPGNPQPALAGASERARAATDVLGAGELADVPARYREATVTVLPSRHEAFGLVLVESLASGTPAVALAEGGPLQILDDPAVGRTAPVGEPLGLARAIGQAVALAADPATPQRCRQHAHRWDWEHAVGPAHERVYLSAVGRSRRAGRADTASTTSSGSSGAR